MARAVVISHPSEVIREGLLSILESDIQAKFICIPNISKKNDQLFTTYSDLVILFPDLKEGKLWFESLQGKSNRFTMISLSLSARDDENNLADFSYNLFAPANELIQAIKSFFNESQELVTDELTLREKEVLRLIALGHTNKSIAESLFISTHTVISHRKNITEKLGIKSIPGLTVYAIIQKIISQSDVANDQLN